MPYLAIEDFKGGLDTRRMQLTSEVGSLQTLKNAHINRGGEIEKALAFVQKYTGLAGTFGFAATRERLYVFGSGPAPGGLSPDLTYQRLQNPDGANMTAVVAIDTFGGLLYVVADFDDGTRYHFYDGVLVGDWFNGLVRSTMTNNDGIAEALRALIDADSSYIATRVGSVITITGASASAFSISATAVNGENNALNDQSAAVATTQNAVAGQVEVLSVGSFRITGGNNIPGTDRITAVSVDGVDILGGPAEVLATGQLTVTGGTSSPGVNKIDAITVNGVDILGASVDHTGNNSTTAAALATQINAFTSSPNYTASAVGAVLTISAVAGSGSSPNGMSVAATVAGDATVGSIVNMAGGSYSGVQWATSNSATAAAVASQINTYTSSTEYTAASVGDRVTITALAGTGSAPNGRVVSVTKQGGVVISDITNMTGGVDALLTDVATGTFGVVQSTTNAMSGAAINFGIKFTATQSGYLKQASINVTAAAATSGYVARLYTNNAGSPGTQIGSDSGTVSISTTGQKDFNFTGTNAVLTAGTTYWLVFGYVSGSVNFSVSCCADQASYGSGKNNTTTSIIDNLGAELRVNIVQRGPAGQPQISTVTVGGTFEPGDLFAVTLAGKTFGASRVTGLDEVKALRIHKNKVYAAHKASLLFSAVAEPTKWKQEDTGSGVIDMSSQASGFEDVNALAVYQNNLAVMARNVTQIWYVDPDPAANSQIQVLENVGTRSPGTCKGFGDSDVFFLSDTGVRSLKARDASNSAAVSDVGTPIDTLIVGAMAGLSEADITGAQAIIEPKDGRYILSLGQIMYVFSFFSSSRVSSWSTYERSLKFDWFAKSGTKIYGRSGNSIYLLGGDNGTTYNNDPVVVELPYIDAGKLANWKQWTGLDLAIEGTWLVECNTDPNQPTVFQTVGTVDKHSVNEMNNAVQAWGPVFKLRFTNQASGAAKIGKILVHYKEAKAT